MKLIRIGKRQVIFGWFGIYPSYEHYPDMMEKPASFYCKQFKWLVVGIYWDLNK